MCDLGMWSGPSRALFINDTLFPVFCPKANNEDTECSILILINFVLNAFLLFSGGKKTNEASRLTAPSTALECFPPFSYF